ncbi:hypothetical protein LCGC14_1561520 [marine sediment metagenome]|uniref:Uncharacterized protein n=1 Tax=marine sediment metagenome TaxID=412755 RepID=A0A0F9LN18_9ZZZZ
MQKWILLYIFVWIIGMFLGSTFEYHSSDTAEGQAYTTGTAVFTNGDATVNGVGTVWVAGMEGGRIKYDADGIWNKIGDVVNNTELTLTALYPSTGGGAAAYTMAVSGGWAGAGSAGLSENPQTTLQYIVNLKNAVQEQPLFGGAISIPFFSSNYFGAVFKMLTWQFDFLFYDSLGKMFYWVVIIPFVAGAIFTLGIMLFNAIFGNISWS